MTTKTIGSGTTISAGYGQINQSGFSLTNQGVLGAAGAAYGVIVAATGDAVYNSGQILADAVFAKGIFANQSVRVTNLSGGTISAGFGLYLLAGGTVSNASGALITGATPVYGESAAVQVRNQGVITGTGTSASLAGVRLKAGGYVYNMFGGSISGANGVYEGVSATVRNEGSIRANGGGGGIAGVSLNAGGAVTNVSKAGQVAAAISGAYAGLMIRNKSGYVYNGPGAMITGGVAGAFLLDGGTLNNSGGTVAANYDVAINGAYGFVENTGLISGGKLGVGMNAGGRVINAPTGSIAGTQAISISGGAGSVYNEGIINAGATGFAVNLAGGFNNILTISPGAAFTGTVSGGNSVGAANSSELRLEIGGTGSIGGFGTQFVNFNHVYVRPSAVWSITSGSIPLGTTFQVDAAGTLTNQATILAQVGLVAYSSNNVPGVTGPEVVNTAGATIGSGTLTSTFGIYDPHPGPSGVVVPADTVVNNGIIRAATAIKLVPAGVVTNQSLGIITGNVPLFFKNSGTVTNQGLILSGSNTAIAGIYLGGGTIINQGTGAITGSRGVRSPGYVKVINYNAIDGFGGSIPLAVEGSTSAARAGVLLGSGFVTNGSTAVIQGPHFGVGIGYKTSNKGSVVNAGTITAYDAPIANNAAVYLFNGGAVTNQTTGLITAVGAGNVFGVRFHGPSNGGLATGTLINQGSISVPTGFGFYSSGGGVVSNTGTGAITALAPIKIQHGYAFVDNQGKISGSTAAGGIGVLIGYGAITNESTGAITAATAVEMNYESGTVTNKGLIAGNSLGAGVYLGAGGAVTNVASAHISGGIGVSMQSYGIVVNSGSIDGVSYGISFGHGGKITNNASAEISGTIGGIRVTGVSGGSITNHLSISGGTFGISLATGGSVSNFSGGLITGGSLGIAVQGGGTVYNATGGTIAGGNNGVAIAGGPATVQNYGYIKGTYFRNNTVFVATAVALAAGFTNRLVIAPGASFLGQIDGGNTIGSTSISTLELRPGGTAGTLTGLGNNPNVGFTNFANFYVDPSAIWTLASGGAIPAGVTFTDNGSLTNLGVMLSTPTLASAGAQLVNAQNASITASQVGVLATAALATVVNNGIIRGTLDTSYGVHFKDGGTVTNQSQGTITAATAIYIGGAAATVVNNGQLLGSDTHDFEVFLSAGGTIQNLGGTIDGGAGVRLDGGPATVVNTGKIAAENAIPVALELSPGFADQLSIAPGAVFGGKVNGGNTIGGTSSSTLVMMTGASAGTISGIGAKYYNFTGFTVVSAATWNLTGTNSIGTGGSLFVAGTAINQGSFDGSISLTAGGFLSNASAAQISGALPVSAAYLQNGPAVTLTNAGIISGTAATTGASGVDLSQAAVVTNLQNAQIRGAQYGVRLDAPANQPSPPSSTVTNSGSITADGASGAVSVGAAVLFGPAAGGITNVQNASISASDTGTGIKFSGPILGSVVNQGMISGYRGISAQAVSVSNGSTGKIQATHQAVRAVFGSLDNQGQITSTSALAVSLADGRVTNRSGGTISGANGIGFSLGGDTVVNYGLIAGTSPSGYSVNLGAGGTNRLIVHPGATFVGEVNGGNTIGAAYVSTLELTSAASAGTVTGLGSQFVNFAQVNIDARATWALTGQNSLAAGAFLSDGADVLDVRGVFLVDGEMDDDAGALNVAGGRIIVENQGTLASVGVAGLAVGQAASGGEGEIDVLGTKSAIINDGSFIIGDDAVGTLKIESRGTATTSPEDPVTPGLVIANTASASGSAVSLSGTGSTLKVTGLLDVGVAGSGGLDVSAGASVSAGTLDAGVSATGIANLSLTGAGSDLTITGSATVGDGGTGVLSLVSGAAFSAASIDEASVAGSDGVITVAGIGSALTLTGSLTVGDLGAGEVSILDGATVSAQSVTIGNASSLSSGNVDIEGAGSRLIVGTGGVLNVGVAGGGSGELTIGPGTTLTSNAGVVEAGHASFNNNGGVVDPPFVDITTTSNSGLGSNLYDLYVENIGAVQIVSGTGTWDTPMLLTGTSVADAQNNINVNGDVGEWQLSSGGTLIVNANTVDSGQAIVFEDATDTLVIGQIVNNGSAGVSGTAPVVDPGAENLLQAGGFAAAIWGYVAGDQILFDNMSVSSASVVNGNTVDLFGPGNVSLGSLAFFTKSGSKTSNASATAAAAQIPCFAEGTRIETVGGLVKVEDLRVGDAVVTADGTAEPIVWLGQRSINCARHPAPDTVLPVRVAAGAFGEAVPVRDLYLSPDHAVFVNGVLVPVKLLINGSSIVQVERTTITYHHVELPDHAVILAEGLPVESYLDVGDRTDFEHSGDVIRLFAHFTAGLSPDAAHGWETRGAAPLVMTGPELAAARTTVAAHASRRPSGITASLGRGAVQFASGSIRRGR